ncbi:HET-domain-containing protein [Apiospora sp. TS-2023a]
MPNHPYFTEEQLVERFGSLDKEGTELYEHAMSDFEEKNVEGLHNLFVLVMGALETEYHHIIPALSRSTGSEESLSFLKQRLIDCQEHHAKCQAQCEDTGWCPTRLVEVTDQQIKLIVCDREPPVSRYATLSHCWGGASILKCTTENLEALQRDIQYDSLPRTFQHVINTIRSLGIRYVWIDSLCIIQNSNEDWQTEAAAMGDVYQHAVLNIAATHGKDSHAGLFTPQYPQTNSAVFQMNGGEADGIEMIVTENLNWTDLIELGSLNQRAWVLQESLLSTRIIHFARGHTFWECAQLCAWELVPRGPQGRAKAPVGTWTFQSVSPLADLDLEGIWALVIRIYPFCNITFQSDKLVALSGIVRKLATRFGDQYHQGLWRGGMEKQLCWASGIWRNDQPRIDQIPSWSWASLKDTQIVPGFFYGGGWKEKSVSVRAAGTASVIDVTEDSMQIRIRCPCYSFEFTSNPIWNAIFKADLVIPGVLPAVKFQATHDTADLTSVGDWLVATMYSGVLYSGAYDIHGLLLEPVPGTCGTYRRRGKILAAECKQEMRELWKTNRLWYKNYLTPIPGVCTKCRDHDDRLGCLITLV